MVIEELWSERDGEQLVAFEKAVALDDLPASLFAIDGLSRERAAEARSLLDGWAARVRAKLGEGASAREQAIALGEVLGGELGFGLDDGARPEGASLQAVLARRRGRPTILASIWLEVGTRAGLNIAVRAFGGRLLVEVGGPSAVLVDPAAGGRVLEPSDPIGGGQGVPHPVGIADLLGGTLDFLAQLHVQRGEPVKAFRAVSFRCALAPQLPFACLQRAALAEQLGAFRFAEKLYQQVAASFPGTQASTVAAGKLIAAKSRGPLLLQ